MSTTQTSERHLTYLLYDPKDGRILGRYSCFDAASGSYLRCSDEQVKAAAVGASSRLRHRFEILELELTPSQKMAELRVDVETKQLVSRSGNGRSD